MTANIPQPVPPAGPGPLRQFEIYLQGAMAGAKPIVPIAFAELEAKAREKLTPEAYAYIACGAGFEHTVEENTAAFDRWRIVPRMLRDVASCDLSIELFGRKLNTPLLVAPIGVQELAHKDGDLATAKAAAAERVSMIFSNQASAAMETMASAMGDEPRWFQLYWSKSDELVASLVRRAEACGCDAIVVTLDTTLLGWRTRDLDYAYLPFIRGMGIAQYTSDPVFRAMLKKPPEEDMLAAAQLFMTIYSNPALTWDKLAFLREHTTKPICSKASTIRTMRARRSIMGSTGSSCRTMAAGRSMAPAPRSMRSMRLPRRSAGARRSSSTAAFVAAPGFSKHWRSVRVPCASAGPMFMGWRLRARLAFAPSCAT